MRCEAVATEGQGTGACGLIRQMMELRLRESTECGFGQ